jgi:hypothetical protein
VTVEVWVALSLGGAVCLYLSSIDRKLTKILEELHYGNRSERDAEFQREVYGKR